ncbi:MAG TPA: carbohydrate ABC transporter permease [Acidimicrobiales bacterium]|nr:carbohydrate ABC transporter permease [Acidimicrobiales bacterium]
MTALNVSVPPGTRPRDRRVKTNVKRSLGYFALIVFALIFIGPFILQVATSFKTDPDASNNPLSLIPHPATISAWRQVFGIGAAGASTDFPRWFFNSVLVSTCITIGRVFLDSLAGYSLARLRFPGRRVVFGLVLGTLAVPGVVLLIPRFLMLKQLGLFNSYPGMILPIAVDATGIFLMRQFFLQVPEALEEAGKVDGASIWQVYWRVVLPVVRPGLITLTILSFQGSWNEFQFFQISTISPKYYTLTTGLANLVGGGLSAGNQYPLKLAAAALTIIPVALMFFKLQKYLVRGGMSGSVKG